MVGLGMQRHQLDHMPTICISLLTDNHTNTTSLAECESPQKHSMWYSHKLHCENTGHCHFTDCLYLASQLGFYIYDRPLTSVSVVDII